MPSTTLTAFAITSPTHSLDLALQMFSSYYNASSNPGLPDFGSGTLLSSGCVVNGTTHCTAACHDPGEVFTDPYTLQDCIIMALLSPLSD